MYWERFRKTRFPGKYRSRISLFIIPPTKMYLFRWFYFYSRALSQGKTFLERQHTFLWRIKSVDQTPATAGSTAAYTLDALANNVCTSAGLWSIRYAYSIYYINICKLRLYGRMSSVRTEDRSEQNKRLFNSAGRRFPHHSPFNN